MDEQKRKIKDYSRESEAISKFAASSWPAVCLCSAHSSTTAPASPHWWMPWGSDWDPQVPSAASCTLPRSRAPSRPSRACSDTADAAPSGPSLLLCWLHSSLLMYPPPRSSQSHSESSGGWMSVALGHDATWWEWMQYWKAECSESPSGHWSTNHYCRIFHSRGRNGTRDRGRKSSRHQSLLST